VVGVQLITQLLKEVEGAVVHISSALHRAKPDPKVIRQVSPHAMLEAITMAQLMAPQVPVPLCHSESPVCELFPVDVKDSRRTCSV
jgi:hypothetical protein